MNLLYSLINQSFFSRIVPFCGKNSLSQIVRMALCLPLFLPFVQAQGQATIGNRIFKDLNNNGVQDEGFAAGLNGLNIQLWSPGTDEVYGGGDDVFISQQMTSNDLAGNPGFYGFSNTPAGKYFVKFPVQNGKLFLTPPATKNNPNRFTGVSAVINLANGVDNLGLDAGYNYLQPICASPCESQFVEEYVVVSPQLTFDVVDEPLSLPQFDPNLGTLKRVELENRLVLTMSYAFENLNTVPRTISLSFFDTTYMTGPGLLSGGNSVVAADTLLSNFPLTANDGVDFSGTDYVSDSLLLGDFFKDTSFTDGGNLAAFIGNGNLDYLVNGIANSISVSSGNTYRLILTYGRVELRVRYIYCKPICASVGDFVWNDLNKDGIQDAGEPGIAGVAVSLYGEGGNLVATTVTDAFGAYLFDNVIPGNYYIQFGKPVEYVFTLQNAGTPINDSDPNPLTGRTTVFTVLPLDNLTDKDAGLIFQQPITASLGNRVWLDANENGLQDPGEVGVANVAVSLLDISGNIVRSTFTNANGEYYFTDLPAGDYLIQVTPPLGYAFTLRDAGSDEKDSDVNVSTGTTGIINLTAGQEDLTWDAGIVVGAPNTASVGDFVWNDLNQNGIQEANEPGIANVRVFLYDASFNLIATSITNIFGYYAFSNVAPGAYSVQFVASSAYTYTLRDAGGNEDLDSDADLSGFTASFIVNAGDIITYIDAGLYLISPPGTAQLGDFVWYDVNKDGIQQANEAGVPGVSVELIDATTNIVIDIKATNGEGFYLFTDLAAGNYQVHFFNLPTNTVFTTQGSILADGTDSNPNASTGITGTISLANAEINLTVDAGIYPAPGNVGKGSIGNFVWIDLNQNGIQEAGEPGVGNVLVLLKNDSGTFTDSTRTDARGYYIFNGLEADTYNVTFSKLPSGFVFTLPQQGADNTKDSDVGATGVTIAPIVLGAGETRLDIDAGIFNPAPLGSIGDFVWFDVIANGIQDPEEVGVPGISVNLFDTFSNFLRTVTTDETGFYLFAGLPAGNYVVQFASLPAGLSFVPKGNGSLPNIDSDVDPLTGVTDSIVLALGQNISNIDAGIVSTRAALGDYVWNDLNRNGIQEANETGLSGITVTLYDLLGNPLGSTVTNEQGFYFFVNVPAGVPYELGFSTLPLGTEFTLQNAGANDDIDSDVDAITGRISVAALTAGEVNLSYDAGIVTKQPTSLTGNTWFDRDRDGLQDAGEKPVPGVTVTLYDNGGNVVGTTVTDANGVYLFENLLPGVYEVRFTTLPPNAVFTTPNVGGDDSIDSDVTNFISGSAGNVTVVGGIRNQGPDAGIVPTATLGGRAFSDDNSDGLQTAGEFGIFDVLVTLYNESNQVVGTQLTTDGGYYLFTNLTPDIRYYVSFDTVFSRSWTYQNIGTNDSIDSDVYNYQSAATPSLKGFTPLLTTLLPGENRRFVDAGYLRSGVVLPVILLDLKAVLVANDGWISWSTSQEDNSAYFQVTRSFDGVNFNEIVGKNIPAKGNSSEKSFYGTIDRGIGAANIAHVYYRLNMIDIDGTSMQSDIVELKVQNMDEILYLNTYPTLVTEDMFHISFQLYGKRFAELRIINEIGQVLVKQDILPTSAVQDLEVDASTWAAGVYVIQVTTEEGQVIQKVVIE